MARRHRGPARVPPPQGARRSLPEKWLAEPRSPGDGGPTTADRPGGSPVLVARQASKAASAPTNAGESATQAETVASRPAQQPRCPLRRLLQS